MIIWRTCCKSSTRFWAKALNTRIELYISLAMQEQERHTYVLNLRRGTKLGMDFTLSFALYISY